RKISPAEEKMIDGIQNKASKAGLDVNIRIIASSELASSAQANLNNVLQAYNQFNIYEYGNAFKTVVPSNKKKLLHNFIFRRFDEAQGIVMNTEELASLWHLPLASTETPNIRWMLSRSAPVPPEVPQAGDLHLGYNQYRGIKTQVYANDSDRRRHFYIVGKTGTGKSYFLRYQVLQDIKAGKGVAVVDPHGDLVDDIMGSIPKDRIDDVVYFNPSDVERPMGLNMLEAPDENMRDFAVQEMISIFYMLFPPEMIGPMFEHSMRNFMLTLMADLENPGTLAEIPRMISDNEFQKKWIAKVTDPVVRSFWEDEMANTSDYHKSETMGYLSSKVGRFVENAMMRNIIGQSRSAFNFREIMDNGKILLVNLSKGQTGEVNANLLGLILVSKLQMAAFTRANIPEEERRDFFLYIDEFQNFITPSIATILSEARKYKLNLILAHQYMGQLVKDGKTEIRDAVLGNVGNMFVSRVGPEDTEVLGKVFEPTFSPYDLMNTDKYTWNTKLIVDNSQAKPFTLKTEAPEKPNPKLFEALKEISRLTYGRPRDLVEREIAIRAGIGASRPAVLPPPPAAR
ncbi:MAG: type IV secretion system DNA-binding domain-containing protein, partial [Patescibacteria group bacterium]